MSVKLKYSVKTMKFISSVLFKQTCMELFVKTLKYMKHTQRNLQLVVLKPIFFTPGKIQRKSHFRIAWTRFTYKLVIEGGVGERSTRNH